MNRQLGALTGLRFAAAFFVVCFHFVHSRAAPDFVAALIEYGNRGVAFFFVLSGFILTYRYWESARPGAGFRREFWAARVARVAPTYYLALILAIPLFVRELVVVYGLAGETLVAAIAIVGAATALMVQTLVPLVPVAHALNSTAWTLSIEAVFYLVFPFFAVRVKRAPLAVLWALGFGGVAMLPVLEYAVVNVLPRSGELLMFSANWAWRAHPFYQLPHFFAGVALGVAFLRQTGGSRAPGFWSRAAGPLTWVFSAASIAYFGLRGPAAAGVWDPMIAAVLFSALIWAFAFSRGSLARLLESRAAQILGEASYSLYILQMPLKVIAQQIYTKVLGVSDTGSGWFQLYLVSFLVLSSVAAYFWFERPAREKLRARFAVSSAGLQTRSKILS
ncbi:MAG TPA: acyltransferase [Bdellovibrionales bacterium]|nr:acyltransferase [Bdellovibrionales bacterium]